MNGNSQIKVRPRLLWLAQGTHPNLPSLRQRVLEIMPYLNSHFDQSIVSAPTTITETLKIRNELQCADIVLLQKELVSFFVIKLLRHFSKRLVYDFDDAVYIRHSKDGNSRQSYKRSKRFNAICRTCDLIIAGNPILANAAKRHSAHLVEVLPTSVIYPNPTPIHNASLRPLRLGWIGTDANLPYIEGIEPVFLHLQENNISFELHVMAGKSPNFKAFSNFQFQSWSSDAEVNFLNSIDIGLMPLTDNEHTRGKCAYKAIQYMSFGKPVVVSNVGINSDWTKGAGFAANDHIEMIDSLRQLISSDALRHKMGIKGTEIVQKYFTREVTSKKLCNILNKLLVK